MSTWAKFKNYVFGTPLPAAPQPPVVEQKQPEPVVADVTPPAASEPKHIDMTINEVKREVTLTVEPAPTVEIEPAKPEKKKAPAKKRTPKKKSN